jgi:hypothetical protein
MFHAGLPEGRAPFQQDERKDDEMRTYGDKTAAVRIQLNDVKQKITAERLASAGDRTVTSA